MRLVEQGDEYFHLADLPSYIETQEQAGNEFNRCRPDGHTKRS